MDARKEQVRELLRTARARIDPREVGFQRGRRQAPGLRREDVAVLAGISVKWYTWLEQGRDLNFSEELVKRVAEALRLSPTERDYLLRLLRKNSAPNSTSEECIGETLIRTIQLAPLPALVMTRRWDIVAWNALTTRVFRDYGAIPAEQRNLLRIVLTDVKYQSDPESYEHMARKLLGEFRLDYGRRARDPAFEQLVAELRQVAPCFDRHWKNVEICNTQRGSVVQHDAFGELSFDRISYVPEDSPFLRVLLFIPRNPRTATIIASLCSPPPETEQWNHEIDAAEARQALRHTNRH
jgi:transcriptional regulator with XRE-family HTH domain